MSALKENKGKEFVNFRDITQWDHKITGSHVQSKMLQIWKPVTDEFCFALSVYANRDYSNACSRQVTGQVMLKT